MVLCGFILSGFLAVSWCTAMHGSGMAPTLQLLRIMKMGVPFRNPFVGLTRVITRLLELTTGTVTNVQAGFGSVWVASTCWQWRTQLPAKHVHHTLRIWTKALSLKLLWSPSKLSSSELLETEAVGMSVTYILAFQLCPKVRQAST